MPMVTTPDASAMQIVKIFIAFRLPQFTPAHRLDSSAPALQQAGYEDLFYRLDKER